MRPPRPLLLALAATLCASGCAEEGEEPKRAVDARTETIHFFPADQPMVAFLDAGTQGDEELARTVRALRSVPALSAFAAGGGAFVREAGLDLEPLAALLTDDDPDDGIRAAQAAYGIAPSDSGSEVLIVLVGERVDEMNEEAVAVAADAGMKERGEIDEARVFSDPQAAMAVRDGVVVIAPDVPSLRAAIELRDADQDEQLDEDQVSAALADLPAEAPLVAYANPGALRESDPGLSLAETLPLTSMKDAGIGVTPQIATIRFDVVAELEPEELAEESQLRVVQVDAAAARRIAGERRRAGNELRNAVIALAPFSARASVSGEELRATIVGSR